MIIEQKRHSTQEQEQWVLREYDFYPQRVEQIGKVKKISCDRGIFALKNTSLSEKQLKWLARCLRHLREESFSSFLPFHANKFGDEFVIMYGSAYYITPWMEDKVEEKYRQNWEMQIMKCVGEMHRKTVHLAEESLLPRTLSLSAIEKRWKKRLKKMDEYKQFAEQREVMSPMEVAFVEKYEYLQKLGHRAIDYLREWHEHQAERNVRYVLCHGHIQRKHVLHDDENCYLIDFEQANMDIPARELALFYRRHIDVSGERAEEVALQWLAAYEKEFPLEREEKLLLAIYLLFPERIFKEIEGYYQKARPWHALKYASYFDRQIKATFSIRKFIKKMLGEE